MKLMQFNAKDSSTEEFSQKQPFTDFLENGFSDILGRFQRKYTFSPFRFL